MTKIGEVSQWGCACWTESPVPIDVVLDRLQLDTCQQDTCLHACSELVVGEDDAR